MFSLFGNSEAKTVLSVLTTALDPQGGHSDALSSEASLTAPSPHCPQGEGWVATGEEGRRCQRGDIIWRKSTPAFTHQQKQHFVLWPREAPSAISQLISKGSSNDSEVNKTKQNYKHFECGKTLLLEIWHLEKSGSRERNIPTQSTVNTKWIFVFKRRQKDLQTAALFGVRTVQNNYSVFSLNSLSSSLSECETNGDLGEKHEERAF